MILRQLWRILCYSTLLAVGNNVLFSIITFTFISKRLTYYRTRLADYIELDWIIMERWVLCDNLITQKLNFYLMIYIYIL